MKFIVSSSALLKNLQAVGGVINSSNTLPILDDFLFELKEKSLIITASDLETTISVELTLDNVEEAGVIAIPAKILIDTLKTFGTDIPVTFMIDEEKQSIEISAGEGKYKISGHSAEEFPEAPVPEEVQTVSLDAEMLSRAFTKTIFATGNDDLRPVMTGVFCELSPDDIIFVATDAHKLVRFRRNDVKSEEPYSFILPKKPLMQLKNILAGQDFSVKIEYNKANAFFSFENMNMVCRLIEGKYPNYDAVIPKENPNVLTVDRASFLNSIRRISIFANQSTNQVRLKITGQELLISAEDVDYSNEAHERLSCNYNGEDMDIGFNSRFLQEMLANIDSDEVKLEMSAPNRAGLIMPTEYENENEDILMLIMPIMLSQ